LIGLWLHEVQSAIEAAFMFSFLSLIPDFRDAQIVVIAIVMDVCRSSATLQHRSVFFSGPSPFFQGQKPTFLKTWLHAAK